MRTGPVGGVGEVEALEQLVAAGADSVFGQVREPADQAQVLVAGEVLVDRGVLAGEADALAHRLRVRGHVDAEHLGPARVVRCRIVVRMRTGGGLARAVRAEQAEHACRSGTEKLDAVERDDRAEPLLETFDDDGVCPWRPPSHIYLNDVKYL